MLRNTLTPALTPLCCDAIAQFASKVKQLLRPVNALRREVISNAFLRDSNERVVSRATMTAVIRVQILNDSYNSVFVMHDLRSPALGEGNR